MTPDEREAAILTAAGLTGPQVADAMARCPMARTASEQAAIALLCHDWQTDTPAPAVKAIEAPSVWSHLVAAWPGAGAIGEDDRDALASMPLRSTCGDDCRAAIDAAAALYAARCKAIGEDELTAAHLFSIAADACCTFICG